jgi:AraC-like DNA-binding protein/mannose-6-phosphate isomerase-like protein (cupin superfamily)
MVRHARAAQVEDVPHPVVAVGNDYAAGGVHPPHCHRRAQLLHAVTGTMIVETNQGSWVVPPQQGLWIPAGVRHGFRMVGNVVTRSAYIEPGATRGLPAQCRVIDVAPLLHHLLVAAVDLPAEYAPGSRADMILTLLLREIHEASSRALCVPFPRDERLAARCQRFLENPTPHEKIDDWCITLGMSRRAFTRMFRSETGLSFAAWQRRAALFHAIDRLMGGEPVTAVALDLGYASPSAFTSMFKRVLGVPPSRYAAVAHGAGRRRGDGA